ncbi:serine/threonine protein kinase [Paractinoplanes deccanensis]|uniref:non-specific serine/threonine protein kinase n=1 Tax=Paractinoplanes deccanensis TaxID=113561 RepID=A0ABQ3XZK5_9ACTN|nr:ATPase domain-containing protein [Actinoplanes deccanensis]GID73180.1 serine/threonine protein kinase [Actinoplanes deccanensis]
MTRLTTGQADLDLVLGGGLEPGSVVVVSGPPGAGKTILAQQLCFAMAGPEHKAVYYTTLSEPHSKLVEHLRDFTFFSPERLGPEVEYVHLGDLLCDSGTNDLAPVVDEVIRKAFDDQPAVVVIDSMKVLRDFVSDHDLRMSLYDLTSKVAHSGTVLMLLGEYTADETQTCAEFTLADGIVQLSYRSREPIDRRGLRVVKMRGTSHVQGTHTVHISRDGVQVYPRIESLLLEEHRPERGRIPTGIEGLDALLGGGIPHSDATLVLGPSGVGKTIASIQFIGEGLAHGERCLYISFQDSAEELIAMAGRLGCDFNAARADGRLEISHVPVGNLDLDGVAAVARHHLAEGGTARIVIDSLAEMAHTAREAERFPAYLRSLLGLVRSAGASLWVTSETRTIGPMDEPLAGLMFLFHNVIQIRYIEHCAEIGRAVNILKMRNSGHDYALYGYHVSGTGVAVGDRIEKVTGMLGWSALRDCPSGGEL